MPYRLAHAATTGLRLPGTPRTVILLLIFCSAISAASEQAALVEIFTAAKQLQVPDQLDGIPDYSAAAVAVQKERLGILQKRFAELDATDWSVHDQVDYLLVRSELDTLEYGLYVYRATSRSPNFYLSAISSFGLSSGATLSRLGQMVMQPPPFDETRALQIITHMQNVPRILEQAKHNLTEPNQEMSRWALLALANARESSDRFAAGLVPHFPPAHTRELTESASAMGDALENYRRWIESRLPQMKRASPIGRPLYDWILRRIWLLPYDADDLLQFGEQEYSRYLAFTALEEARNRSIPWPEGAETTNVYAANTASEEKLIRQFLSQKGVLTIPEYVGPYRRTIMPDYIQAFELWAGLSDYSTPGNGTVKYSVPEDHAYVNSYWESKMRIDPSTNIFHDGIPGHHFQGIVSSRHPSPIRANRIDRVKSEGWSTYWEEAAIQLGFYDQRPHSRELIYNFLRLRALRVIVDVKMALGEMSVEEATAALMKVPMDRRIASEEASDFFAAPTGGIVYQIGKTQIEQLLGERRKDLGADFDLRAFHDAVVSAAWVPLELTRWEMTGRGERVLRMLADDAPMPRH